VCSPSAALGGASKILSGIGQSQQIKAQNAAKRRNWERAMETRKRSWLQQRTVYSAKVTKRAIDLNENDLAANRAYELARQKLNNTRSQALAKNEAGFMKMVKEKLGKAAAKGVTGRSAARYETMVSAEYGREVGKRLFAVTRGREAYLQSIENTRRQALSARNKLAEPLVPVPSMAPQYPPMQNANMPIFMGVLGAAAGGFKAMEDNPLSGFDQDMAPDWDVNPIPTGADGFTDWSQAEVIG
tara:strand:- start:251 stop:979 length:729 start_codon:yes stop_codon:yes gene_type:complete